MLVGTVMTVMTVMSYHDQDSLLGHTVPLTA
jgi:hypothetical protein